MNLQSIKIELDRGVDYILPAPVGFSLRRTNILTKIKKSKGIITYTIKIK